jgi:hypothetical protein
MLDPKFDFVSPLASCKRKQKQHVGTHHFLPGGFTSSHFAAHSYAFSHYGLTFDLT